MSTAVNVKIHGSDKILKQISEPIQLNDKNWTEYTKSLKNIQKNVNVYLSELVEQEKGTGETMNLEDQCEESDEEDETTKRKVNTVDSNKSRKKFKFR